MRSSRALSALLLLATTRCTFDSSAATGRTMFQGVPLASNVHCSTADCHGYRVEPDIKRRTAVSVECYGDTPPGSTPNPVAAPKSYLVSDIGKRGVPQLAPRDRNLIARIRRYLRSKTLRFAWVERMSNSAAPIVFDASDGPCTVGSLGYAVLDGACNEYYKPGEDPYRTFPAPGEDGCYRPSPRPWMIGS